MGSWAQRSTRDMDVEKEQLLPQPEEDVESGSAPILAGALIDARTKMLIWLAFVAYLMYIWSLPALSWFFNQYLGQAEELCWLPAEDVHCGDGSDYVALALAANRSRNGVLYGCGCGQGVFGDILCAAKSKFEYEHGTPIGFTISQLISTAPATGGMALVSIAPIVTMWLYGVVDLQMRGTIKKAVTPRDGGHTNSDNLIWHRDARGAHYQAPGVSRHRQLRCWFSRRGILHYAHHRWFEHRPIFVLVW